MFSKSVHKLPAIAIAVSLVLPMLATSASAGGLLGDAINKVAPGVGTALDREHKRRGNPIERGIGATLDKKYPGAGRLYLENAPGVRR